MIPHNKQWRVTFKYGVPNHAKRSSNHRVNRATEYVSAPTKLLALWNAREQRHGCIIADPDCIKETVGLCRQKASMQ